MRPKKRTLDNSNRKLTVKQARNYVKKGGCKCPHCGCYDVEGGSIETEEGWVYQDLHCHECLGTWRDVYTLSDVQNI